MYRSVQLRNSAVLTASTTKTIAVSRTGREVYKIIITEGNLDANIVAYGAAGYIKTRKSHVIAE